MIGTTTRARALRRHCLQAACLLAVALASCSGGRGPGAGAGAAVTALTPARFRAARPALDPGTKDMHRLNSTEYNATVPESSDRLQPANGSWRGGELAGFDNMASVLGVDEAQYNRYFNAAKDLATEVWRPKSSALASSPAPSAIRRASARASKPLGCDCCAVHSTRKSCKPTGASTTRRATLVTTRPRRSRWRCRRCCRAPNSSTASRSIPTRIDRSAPARAVRARVAAVLFSLEQRAGRCPLEAAADGSLIKPATLSANVDRMLDDPKAERLVANFAGQWLGARDVLSHPVASKSSSGRRKWHTPPAKRSSSISPTSCRAGDLGSIPGRTSISSTGPRVFLRDTTTTSVVGVFQRVEYHGDRRAGFFGLAGFLAVSSSIDARRPRAAAAGSPATCFARIRRLLRPNVPKLERR